MENKLLTTGKVAEILETTARTIQLWIKDGKLKPAKITDTGRYLFSAEQIEHFKNGMQNTKQKSRYECRSGSFVGRLP